MGLPNSCYSPHQLFLIIAEIWIITLWHIFCTYNFYVSLLPTEWNLKILTQHSLPSICPTHSSILPWNLAVFSECNRYFSHLFFLSMLCCLLKFSSALSCGPSFHLKGYLFFEVSCYSQKGLFSFLWNFMVLRISHGNYIYSLFLFFILSLWLFINV